MFHRLKISFQKSIYLYICGLIFFCGADMGEAKDNDAYEEELLDYEEEEEKAPDGVAAKATGEAAKK